MDSRTNLIFSSWNEMGSNGSTIHEGLPADAMRPALDADRATRANASGGSTSLKRKHRNSSDRERSKKRSIRSLAQNANNQSSEKLPKFSRQQEEGENTNSDAANISKPRVYEPFVKVTPPRSSQRRSSSMVSEPGKGIDAHSPQKLVPVIPLGYHQYRYAIANTSPYSRSGSELIEPAMQDASNITEKKSAGTSNGPNHNKSLGLTTPMENRAKTAADISALIWASGSGLQQSTKRKVSKNAELHNDVSVVLDQLPMSTPKNVSDTRKKLTGAQERLTITSPQIMGSRPTYSALPPSPVLDMDDTEKSGSSGKGKDATHEDDDDKTENVFGIRINSVRSLTESHSPSSLNLNPKRKKRRVKHKIASTSTINNSEQEKLATMVSEVKRKKRRPKPKLLSNIQGISKNKHGKEKWFKSKKLQIRLKPSKVIYVSDSKSTKSTVNGDLNLDKTQKKSVGLKFTPAPNDYNASSISPKREVASAPELDYFSTGEDQVPRCPKMGLPHSEDLSYRHTLSPKPHVSRDRSKDAIHSNFNFPRAVVVLSNVMPSLTPGQKSRKSQDTISLEKKKHSVKVQCRTRSLGKPTKKQTSEKEPSTKVCLRERCLSPAKVRLRERSPAVSYQEDDLSDTKSSTKIRLRERSSAASYQEDNLSDAKSSTKIRLRERSSAVSYQEVDIPDTSDVESSDQEDNLISSSTAVSKLSNTELTNNHFQKRRNPNYLLPKVSIKHFRNVSLLKRDGYCEIIITVESCKESAKHSGLKKEYNFMDANALKDLIDVLELCQKKASCKAVLLSSIGPIFSSGLNPLSLLNWVSTMDASYDVISLMKRLVTILIDYKKPVVAAVQGPAVGFGASILLLCDAIYASDRAHFQWPDVAMGLSACGCVTSILPRQIGPNKARSIIINGDILTAKEAYNHGLVCKVFLHESFRRNVAAECNKLVCSSTMALLNSKELLSDNDCEQLTNCIAKETKLLKKCLMSTECQCVLQEYIRTQLLLQ